MSFPMVALGDVVRHRNEFIQIDDLENYKRCRVQLHAQGIVLRDIVLGAEIKTKKQQVCRTGEFLVAEIDAKIGGFGIVPPELHDSIVSSHYFLFVIDETRLDRRFLDFFIRTPYFREQVTAQGTTNYAAIRPANVLGYKIPFLPLPEQRRIVARIEELEAKIEEARGLRRKAGEETEAIKKSLVKIIFEMVEKQHNISDKLANVVRILGGGTPSKYNFAYWNGKIPWVSPKDMKSSDIIDSEDHITEDAISSSSTILIPENSVLVVVRSGILQRTIPVAINRVQVTINQDMKALLPNQDLMPEYLRWWFKGREQQLLKCVKGGTTVQSLVWEKIKIFDITIPPLPEQRRIVAYLDELQAKVDILRRLQVETGAELDALMPAVLDRAFKGEM